jgi:hypothetical protein
VAVSLTYDATLSRVLIDADGLAGADYATVERSLDQITWETVRGGGEIVDLTGGAFDVPLSDYEFAPGVINYYRVRGVVTDPITYVAAGSGTSNANAGGVSTLTPALPAGLVVGDLLILVTSIRNTGGAAVVPTGWTDMASVANLAVMGRRYESGDAAPLVSYTGGVANATLLGVIIALRNAELTPVTSDSQANASAQNVAYPALTMPADNLAVLAVGWKQDDWTGAATLAGFTEAVDMWDTVGDDAAQAVDYVIQTTAADITAGSFTITGGASAVSRGTVLALEQAGYLNSQTDSITPEIEAVWLKSVARPFLNQTVTAVAGSRFQVVRPARTGVFDIVGRTMPVAVNDVRKSRRWTMQVRTETADDRDALALLLASGDVLLVQAPPACAGGIAPTGYVTVGDYEQEIHPLRPLSVLHTLPCTEVAEPSADVVAAAQTWATVLATYATWSDVIAAHPDWADLLTLIGDPSEVIVP